MTAPELVPGAIVAGRYGIQALLQHAGSIATYQAITAPNREVAIKLYDPALKSSPEVLKTLARYQMVASSLPGNWIAPIVDSGEDSDTAAPFTVTDFEAHPSLAQLVELCPLSAPEMVLFVRNLARGLDLLHANGIAHLSLCPTNVFVGPAPAFETRVADFGMSLVRKALPNPEKDVAWVPWLSPEQVDEAAVPGPAADVFALALVAFFAATGKKYWRSCQTRAADWSEWKREIAGPRTPASQRAKELAAPLGQAFDGAFTRALAASPKDRFASPGQFAAALQAAAALHATVTGAVPSPPLRPVPSRAPEPPRAPSLAPLKKPLPTMMGIGFAGTNDVPPPPPQLEAVLATFEAPAVATVSAASPSEAPTQIIVGSPLATEEPIEVPGLHRGGPDRRSRTLWITGSVAVLVGMIGAFLALGRTGRVAKPEAPLLASSTLAPATASAVATADPLPTATPEPPSPPPAAAPPPEAPTAEVAEQVAAPKPVRAPSWHRKPVPTAAPAPAKKPCGKFLKRCP